MLVAFRFGLKTVELDDRGPTITPKRLVHQCVTFQRKPGSRLHFVNHPDVRLESGLLVVAIPVELAADFLDFGVEAVLTTSDLGGWGRKCLEATY